MKLTAILASAVLIEAHVSSLRSKMMINLTPGCLVLQEKRRRVDPTMLYRSFSHLTMKMRRGNQ